MKQPCLTDDRVNEAGKYGVNLNKKLEPDELVGGTATPSMGAFPLGSWETSKQASDAMSGPETSLPDDVRPDLKQCFDTNLDGLGAFQAHDTKFTELSAYWINLMTMGQMRKAEHYWRDCVEVAISWEKAQNRHVHKGTPYYFWGVTCILNGDLERGFLLVHQAYEEDRHLDKDQADKKPAYSLASLDYKNQNQFFKARAEEVAEFLTHQLETYRQQTGMHLTRDDFRAKFLQNQGLADEVFLFVFVEFALHKLRANTVDAITQNMFGSLLEARHLFSLCLIIDGTLRPPFQADQKKRKGKEKQSVMFSDLVKFACPILGQEIVDANSQLQDNLAASLSDLVTGNKLPNRTTLNNVEASFAVAYCLRNFGGHNIESQKVLYELFPVLTQRVLNALFYSVEAKMRTRR